MEELKNERKKPIVIDVSKLDPAAEGLSIEQIDASLEEHPAIEPNSNSRCVPVGTKIIAPGGRNKKEMFKAKREFVKFRCSVYEKKLLYIKAKRCRLSVSEFCRRSIFNLEIKERFSHDQIEIMKTLSKFHNNFKSIGNMFRKKDPKLSAATYALADQIKQQLEKLQK
ncbi:mobilization protein MbpA [Salinimicrobium terrae]|uniref:mobilization protein MbpA n=1 Tax=Salinimicrobium terrae TaxID=470866 RepID=UPI0003F5244E|nr:mobilization protein MbpA [Salinimicrobium terrae]